MSLTPLAVAPTTDLTISATKNYLVDIFLVLGIQNWAQYPDAVSLGNEQRTLMSLVCFYQYRSGCGKIVLLQGLGARVGQELILSRTEAQGQTGR